MNPLKPGMERTKNEQSSDAPPALQVQQLTQSSEIELKTEEEYRALIGEKAFLTIQKIFGRELDPRALKIVAALRALMDSNANPHSELAARAANAVTKKNGNQKENAPESRLLKQELESNISSKAGDFQDGRVRTLATRFDKWGNETTSGNDENILALVYFLASKGIEYRGKNSANATQSTSAHLEILYDEAYQQALGLFISYVNGEKDYADRRKSLKTVEWKGKRTQLQKVADDLYEARPAEGERYCTSQIFQMLVNLKSYADLPIMQSEIEDLAALEADNPQRLRDINNLGKSLQELHDMFVQLSTIIDIYGEKGLKMQEAAHDIAVLAAEGASICEEANCLDTTANGVNNSSWESLKTAQEKAKKVVLERKVKCGRRLPGFFDQGKKPTDRAYHDKCDWTNIPLSKNIIALMKDYFSNGKGFFLRSHKKDAQIILGKIEQLPENDKDKPLRLFFIVLNQLSLSAAADKSDEKYSAFRARCIYILKELGKKIAAKEVDPELEAKLPSSVKTILKDGAKSIIQCVGECTGLVEAQEEDNTIQNSTETIVSSYKGKNEW